MESNFTPRYEWLDTVDNGWPESEYLCVLGLVLFVIGRWTHLDTLNSICHLSDHVATLGLLAHALPPTVDIVLGTLRLFLHKQNSGQMSTPNPPVRSLIYSN